MDTETLIGIALHAGSVIVHVEADFFLFTGIGIVCVDAAVYVICLVAQLCSTNSA